MSSRKSLLSTLALLLLVSGCANRTWQPIVDMQGVDQAAYQRDLTECQAYTEQVQVAGSTAAGAARGAVLGGVFGAIFGNSSTAAKGAGAGGAAGAVGGASRGMMEKRMVLRNCMIGRGYRILN